MFYRTGNHPLPHDPLKAIVGPRPIGWISTTSKDGADNLAPYSFFNLISDTPPLVMFSSDGMKDSARNAKETGVFACNLAIWDLKDAMNASSAMLGAEVSEFDVAGLTRAPCQIISAPRVQEAPVVLECETVSVEQLKGRNGVESTYYMVIGQVVGVDIDEVYLVDGKLDVSALKPLSRMGYRDYAVIDSVFEMGRPRITKG